MSIPRQLITYLNSGKCFALVGSGPSTGMEYPSWRQLAQNAIDVIPKASLTADDKKSLATLLAKGDYPEVFQIAADHLGGVAQLLNGLKTTCTPTHKSGIAYEFLAKWPFRCYLTTNYDDELQLHLKAIGEYFSVLKNSQTDLAQITSDSAHRIVKLHGDFSTPDDIVLTTSQYTAFETGGLRSYFRSKLTSIFQMVPVVVIGHSMNDRDLRLVLQCAKECICPDKPTYVLVADAQPHDIGKYHREYNIHLISYPNPDRTHKTLLHLLRQIDRFVIPRTEQPAPPLDFPDPAEAAAATSLYIHSSLSFAGDVSLLHRVLEPQILGVLAATSADGLAESEMLAAVHPKTLRTDPSVETEFSKLLGLLQSSGAIQERDHKWVIATKGRQALDETKRRREVEEDIALGSLRTRLEKHGPTKDVSSLVSGFRKALLAVFRTRGLATAELLFRENPFAPADMPELFDAVFPHAATVKDFGLRAEYCNAVMDFLTQPTQEQKEYLAHLAQGFFAYHMLGLDPTGRELRHKLALNTVWILDSNVLMPLAALESQRWSVMNNLLERLQSLGITPITTPAFIDEAWGAFRWMRLQLQGVPDGFEMARLLEVVQRPDYTEDPFVDGYIMGCASGRWASFSEFVDAIGGHNVETMTASLTGRGIRLVKPFEECSRDESGEIPDITQRIVLERERLGTLRAGEPQAHAEAEALQLIRHIRENGFQGTLDMKRAFFVSTSRLLDSMYNGKDGLLTWYPDTLYKHVQYLAGDTLDPEVTFEAISTTYYSAGVNVIDEHAYLKYFKPAVTESSITLKREANNYVKALVADVSKQQQEQESLWAHYRATPDLEKPQFVSQLGWIAARNAERRAEVAEKAKGDAEIQAERQIREVKEKYARKERARMRHEEGRRKNLGDQKHLAKRRRQAKDRKRQKKRGK